MRTFQNPDEALDYVLSIADAFRIRGGIEVYFYQYDLEDEHWKKMANECRGKESCAHPTKWGRINFTPKDEHGAKEIFEAQKLLGDLGISFDSGCGFGDIDWETDWSFSYDQSKQIKKINKVSLDSIGELQ